MVKAIEEGMENLNERLKKANQFPHGPFHHDLLEIEHLDYCVKMAEIQVQQAQLHLQSARQELSEFPARTPEHRWRALPTLGGVKFTNWDDLDAFSSLMSDHPFLNEFAAFCAEVQIVEKPRRVPSSAPSQRATHWLAGPLVQKAEHTRWFVDWMSLPGWSSYANCSLLQRKGEWMVSTTAQHRLSLPSHWNVRRF